ncbi:MAG: HAD family hydrolase [Polyangiales bacterium]
MLGGSPDERKALADALRRRSGETKLIFVTGRGMESILPLLGDPLVPQPEYVIADVGATIVRTSDMAPIQPLQSNVAARWPGERPVHARMRKIDGARAATGSTGTPLLVLR